VPAAEFTGRNPGFSFAENTDDLFVEKTLLHEDVLMWLMKTLLTSRCINQREQVNLATDHELNMIFIIAEPLKPLLSFN